MIDRTSLVQNVENNLVQNVENKKPMI